MLAEDGALFRRTAVVFMSLLGPPVLITCVPLKATHKFGIVFNEKRPVQNTRRVTSFLKVVRVPSCCASIELCYRQTYWLTGGHLVGPPIYRNAGVHVGMVHFTACGPALFWESAKWSTKYGSSLLYNRSVTRSMIVIVV